MWIARVRCDASRGYKLELLHSVVPGVHDVEVALLIDGHRVRRDELAGLLSETPDSGEEFTLRSEELHAAIQAADPDTPFSFTCGGIRRRHGLGF